MCWKTFEEFYRKFHFLIELQYLCETIEPFFKHFKCSEMMCDELKRRILYNARSTVGMSSNIDDSATVIGKKSIDDSATVNSNRKNSVLCVSIRKVWYTNTILTVQKFDESLDKSTPQFTMQVVSCFRTSMPILYGNKVFFIGGYDEMSKKINSVSSSNRRCPIQCSKYSRSFTDDLIRYENWRKRNVPGDESTPLRFCICCDGEVDLCTRWK